MWFLMYVLEGPRNRHPLATSASLALTVTFDAISHQEELGLLGEIASSQPNMMSLKHLIMAETKECLWGVSQEPT